jgi:electron transfer flavoprotein alpha subunit
MLSSSLRRVATATSSRCWASTLVVSEPLIDGATPPGTQSAVTAASQLGQAVDLLVISDTAPSKVPEGVTKVYHVAIGDKLAESSAAAVHAVASSKDCNKVVGTSSKWGSTVIPRAAALLDASPITDILQIESEGTLLITMYIPQNNLLLFLFG